MPESANQLTALQKGDADIALNLTAEQLATLSGDATSVKGQDLRLFYLGMNATVPPLDKVEVREALRMAIDYDGIVNDLLSGNAQKVQTIIPSPMFGFNSDAPFQQDVEGAKALLEKAGVSDVSLEMMIPSGAAPGGVQWSDLAAKLQSDWDQIGVTVDDQAGSTIRTAGCISRPEGPTGSDLLGSRFRRPRHECDALYQLRCALHRLA